MHWRRRRIWQRNKRGQPGTVARKKIKKDSGIKINSAKNQTLRAVTEKALSSYFKTLNGHKPGDLYDLVMREVEQPLFKAVMDFAQGNQTRAADILGINRGTLRKKLKNYGLMQ
jgi:Fis family transcriptional regulator